MTHCEKGVVVSLYFLTKVKKNGQTKLNKHEIEFVKYLHTIKEQYPEFSLPDNIAECLFALYYKYRIAFPLAKERIGNHIYFRHMKAKELKKLLTLR